MQVKIPQRATAVRQAVTTALRDYDRADIGVMPYGGLVLPVVPQEYVRSREAIDARRTEYVRSLRE